MAVCMGWGWWQEEWMGIGGRWQRARLTMWIPLLAQLETFNSTIKSSKNSQMPIKMMPLYSFSSCLQYKSSLKIIHRSLWDLEWGKVSAFITIPAWSKQTFYVFSFCRRNHIHIWFKLWMWFLVPTASRAQNFTQLHERWGCPLVPWRVSSFPTPLKVGEKIRG